ncbi:MAG: tetratricopeptide repeat protein [Ardenticatenaceae bacterium]|nr:tetratricopeptide repeat protein [Ardenticatenaceae bacterium]
MMRHLVPQFILEQYALGARYGRLTGTVLFVDTSGFSAIMEQMMQYGQHGAEVLAGVMREVFEPLVERVYGDGGFVVGFAGDAFTAVFQDERQALLAAVWMQATMQQQVMRQTPYGSFAFGVKIGVAQGDVEWGILEDAGGGRATYYFRGEAVENSALAQQLAEQGDLIVHAGLRAAAVGMLLEPVNTAYYRIVSVVEMAEGNEARTAVPLPNPGELALRFFPEAILQQRLNGEFRQVINMFIGLTETPSDAELAEFIQLVFALQSLYGGLMDRVRFGDKGCHILLFWGAPISYENDMVRALNFILDLRAQARVPLQVGITYHVAHAGFVGSPLHEEYTCYGRGVNLAARLMTLAPLGAIWVDGSVAEHGGKLFEIAFTEEVQVKGVAGKLAVYGLNGRQSDQPQQIYPHEMIGREGEVAQIHQFLQPLLAGQFAGMLGVYGEAGMGKSRLVYEAVSRLQQQFGEEAFWFFICQTDEMVHQPLHPFRYFLRQFFEYASVRDEGENKRAFEQKLAEVMGQTTDVELRHELERTRSFLGALLDLYWPDSLYERVEPELRQQNSFLAVVTLLKVLSGQRPLLLHVEDVQWLDGDSRQLLCDVAGYLAGAPVAVLVTAREPESIRAIWRDRPLPLVELQALTLAEVGQLAWAVWQQPASPELIALLMARADGHPFYVEQIALYMQEQDVLMMGVDGLELKRTQLLLPVDVWAVLIARLDRLTRSVREVVQTAAVLGREFALPVLLDMLREDSKAQEKVETAVQSRIWLALTEITYLFRHALLREAAYQMQLQAQRQQLHLLAAEAIQRIFAADLSPYYADLVYHYRAAGDGAAEGAFARLAGMQAAARFANQEALNYLNRALVLTAVDNLTARYELLCAREAIYHVQGSRQEQLADLQALEEIANQLANEALQVEILLRWSIYAEVISDFKLADVKSEQAALLALTIGDTRQQATAHMRWGRSQWRQGAFAEARDQLSQALRLVDEGQVTQVQADSLRTLGALAAEQGVYVEADLYFQQALEICRQLHDKKGESDVLNGLGVVSSRLGNYEAAKEHYEAALQIRQEMGNRRGQGQTMNNLGVVYGYLGDYAQSKSYYEQALRIRQQIGDRRGEGLALGNLGAIYVHLGDYHHAEMYCQQSLALSQAIGDRWGEGWSLAYLALVAHLQGQQDEALRLGEAARQMTTELGDRPTLGGVLVTLGQVRLALQQWSAAEADFEEALVLRRALNEQNRTMEPLAGLALVALLRRQLTRARGFVTEILDFLQGHALGGTVDIFWIYRVCYDVLRAVGDERADVILGEGVALLQAQAARISDEGLRRSYLEEVEVHRELVAVWNGRNLVTHLP